MDPRAHQAIRQWHHHLALLLAGLCIWMSIAAFAENVSVTPPGLSPLLVSGAPATNTPAGPSASTAAGRSASDHRSVPAPCPQPPPSITLAASSYAPAPPFLAWLPDPETPRWRADPADLRNNTDLHSFALLGTESANLNLGTDLHPFALLGTGRTADLHPSAADAPASPFLAWLPDPETPCWRGDPAGLRNNTDLHSFALLGTGVQKVSS